MFFSGFFSGVICTIICGFVIRFYQHSERKDRLLADSQGKCFEDKITLRNKEKASE